MTDSTNSRFQRGPNPGGSGNPGGVYNTAPAPEIQPGYYGQQANQGRYRPPTMGGNGTDPSNWNDYGGYSYNVPNHYGVGSGWQSPQMSPFPQFAQAGNRNLDYYLQQGRQAERNTRAGIADGSVVPVQTRNADGSTTTRYTRPGQQGGYAWGGPEAYAAWQANRNAIRGNTSASDLNGAMTAYQQGLAGEAPPTSGSPYRAPQETHVGGPSTYPTKGPPVNGGTKGPAIEEEIPLEDWMPRFRSRNTRWGRY